MYISEPSCNVCLSCFLINDTDMAQFLGWTEKLKSWSFQKWPARRELLKLPRCKCLFDFRPSFVMVIFLFVNNGVWNSVQNSSTISITSFHTIRIWQYTISFPFLFSLSPSLGMIGSSVLHFNGTLMLPIHPHFYYPFLWTHMWIVHYFKFLIFYHTFHCILWSLVDYIFKSQRKQEAVRWFICQ